MNTDETKQIAVLLHQVVQAHSFQGQQAEIIINLKNWLAAITKDELIVVSAHEIETDEDE